MITATNKGGSSYEPVPAGTYVARCYSMVQIGTVDENIMGAIKKLHKVRISWELPTELKVFKEENGEQPYVISKEFTLSMHEKATLRKFLEGWRGKAFTEKESEALDITVLIGKPCMLSIIHKTSKSGSTYAEISSCSAMPKGMEAPPQINDDFILSFDSWSEEKFNTLPEFLKNKITSSEEYQVLHAPNVTYDNGNDFENDLPNDLPF